MQMANGGGLPPQLMQNIRQVKQMMQMAQGNPNAVLQNNPMLNQVMQAYQGQNPEQIFKTLCQQKGIDPNAILNELRN